MGWIACRNALLVGRLWHRLPGLLQGTEFPEEYKVLLDELQASNRVSFAGLLNHEGAAAALSRMLKVGIVVIYADEVGKGEAHAHPVCQVRSSR
jgi:hypothetical protein